MSKPLHYHCLGTMILILITGCASHVSKNISAPVTPSSSGTIWRPTEPQKKLEFAPFNVPAEYANKETWSLPELIDLALQTSNDTRISWFQARAAAAEMQSKKGEYYPDVDLSLETTRIRGSAIGGRFTFAQTSTRPFLELSWILFDFGKRRADVEEAKQRLIAANFIHNAAIQNVILKVQQAYYQFLNARALAQSQEADLKRAQANLDAADQRHDAGVATIADVLQARTALSQAQLSLDTTRGAIQILRGVLAVAIGVGPAVAEKLEVADELPAELPLDQTSEQVEPLIRQAIAMRPDLDAARSEVFASQAHIRSTQAERFPSIEFNTNADRLYYLNASSSTNNYLATLAIRFPLFDGFSRAFNVLQAKEEAEAGRARVASLQQQVGLQVWTSYFNLNTAKQKIRTAQNLLKSAQESYDVALGRYQEGVGSILDLLSAQSALQNAKSQEAQTRTEWLLAVAQLAHDTGSLGLTDGGSSTPKGELK